MPRLARPASSHAKSTAGNHGGVWRHGLLSGIENALLDFITATYDAIGWPGVFLLMALETVVFPIPSEAVMPLAGWKLIADKGHGWYWLILAGVVGGAGSTAGGIGVYYISKLAGAPFLRKYGKWVLISHDDLDTADRFFDRWGVWAVFFGRMVPLVRTLVSVPAGVTAMPIVPFTIYTFMGSFVWAVLLAFGGYKLGQNYDDIRGWMQPVQYPVAIALAAAVGWYVYRHIRKVWFEETASAADQE